MILNDLGHRLARLFSPRPRSEPTTAPSQPQLLPSGFSPITEHAEDDIFLVGYPKSGNTWAESMLVGAAFGIDLELAPDSLVKDLVPDVHYRPFYKRYASPVIFKSHALPDPHQRRVIYLLRDGRDVMVSYHHFLEALQNRQIDFLNLVRTGQDLFPCKWQRHVQEWLANPYQCQMIVVRYEDMQKDPVKELRRMCEFAGFRRDPSVIETAVRKASFAKMQNREKRMGWEGGRWPKDKAFIRRGVVGSYADEMPSEVLEAFVEEAGETLKQLGYVTQGMS